MISLFFYWRLVSIDIFLHLSQNWRGKHGILLDKIIKFDDVSVNILGSFVFIFFIITLMSLYHIYVYIVVICLCYKFYIYFSI